MHLKILSATWQQFFSGEDELTSASNLKLTCQRYKRLSKEACTELTRLHCAPSVSLPPMIFTADHWNIQDFITGRRVSMVSLWMLLTDLSANEYMMTRNFCGNYKVSQCQHLLQQNCFRWPWHTFSVAPSYKIGSTQLTLSWAAGNNICKHILYVKHVGNGI